MIFLASVAGRAVASTKGGVPTIGVTRTLGGVSVNLYSFWGLLRPPISSFILGAWLTLAATRRWRPSTDVLDRWGRVLGWAWLMLIGWTGFIYILAWS